MTRELRFPPRPVGMTWAEYALVHRHGKRMTGSAPTGELAHSTCIAALRAGIKLGQESLV